MNKLGLNIEDTFNKELPADPILENGERQVKGVCFSYVTPKQPASPTLVHASEEVADLIGLDRDKLKSGDFLNVVSGAEVLDGTNPYAMCYGGHQFGSWAGQLGDGRAINLAEAVNEGKGWLMQLKGAGKTPYSRGADGLAVLRSSIREHLCGEAMYHLGVPTSRSLSLALTGDQVVRDKLYDGNRALENGAIVCRVARSFIRFGSFEIHLANQDVDTLRKLADYTIKHYYPEIEEQGKEKYTAFFKRVTERSLEMVVHWQRVGFVHGVMNTDNMSILGDTIDYGPYGWLEGYDHGWTPNTTDNQHKRYRYGAQPEIVFWNLLKLANALYPLVEDAKPFEDVLNQYKVDFSLKYGEMMRSKLGLVTELPSDRALIKTLEENLQLVETDMTIFFRNLTHYNADFELKEGVEALGPIMDAFYEPSDVSNEVLRKWIAWLRIYITRLSKETRNDRERKAAMDNMNPKYVLRNYMAQLAIDAADNGDFSVVQELYTLLQKPYDEQPEMEKYFAKRPEWARHKVGCSMLSCSS
jgi:uncharacterized protein YdiU (UPF0061 family)